MDWTMKAARLDTDLAHRISVEARQSPLLYEAVRAIATEDGDPTTEFAGAALCLAIRLRMAHRMIEDLVHLSCFTLPGRS